MSAVIGILNKHAVALAADSAVTLSGGGNRKILNTANKIFTISKYHPVGIMVYNSAEFMGTPWEIIVKMYREQLGDKAFKKVDDYRKDFIKYIRSRNFFSDEEDEKRALQNYFYSLINQLNNEAVAGNESLLIDLKKNTFKIYTHIENMADNYLKTARKDKPLDEFKSYTVKQFKEFSMEPFEQILSIIFENLKHPPPDKLKKTLHNLLYYCLKSKNIVGLQPFSGLVFVGYGDEQFYPHLVPVNIMLAIEGNLRACIDNNKSAHISNKTNSVISPFAQTDVIESILRGVDPDLENIYRKNFSSFLDKYNEWC